jgi:hypothetical protein
LNAKGVDAKSETRRTANDILRKVKKHVPGKPAIGRMGNHSSPFNNLLFKHVGLCQAFNCMSAC